MTYTIKILHYGTQRVRGPQVFFQSNWTTWFVFYYFVFLIRGAGVTAIVDCGTEAFAPVNELLRLSLGEEGIAQPVCGERSVMMLLENEGVRPEDVDIVALTHFHWDHIGNVALFPNAKFLISAEGWKCHQELLAHYPQMVSDPIFPTQAIDFLVAHQDRLELLPDGSTPLPGVEIHYIGGHTADSAAFVIPTEEGRVVIPGDTIWTYANLDSDIPIGAAVNIRQCYDAMAWARTAGDLLLPAHDPQIVIRHPQGVGLR